ncbi:MAG: GlxA family transcriptional regulator [Proteobacteria bacterium]|nr:GlxA family transcriptional regulator [Pseudomonadota bacterium]
MTTAPLTAILIFPGFQLLDATGPASTFEIAAHRRPDLFRQKLVAPEAGPVMSTSGVAVLAEGLPDPRTIDTLVIAGGEGTRQARFDPTLQVFIRATARHCRRVASVCSGTYLLAEAGLLDGKRATTHWRVAPGLQRQYPNVRIEPDRIWVRDGQVWTSAGITAGIDLALALVGEDGGEELSRAVAQELVVFHRRPGGQSQYSALLELESPQGRFAALLGWMRERLAEPLGVERLAAEAAMSPRNFARAFLAETGSTPAKAVERLRVEAARALVEAEGQPIEAVAQRTGFGDPERMRRAFLRAFGQPPQALRRGARSA